MEFGEADQFPFSKDKLFSYYRHFLANSLIFEARILSASTYKRMRNLPKIYLVDTGLAQKIMTSDYGRRLENAVYLELKRRVYEIHYLNDEGECDFLAKRGNGWEAIQSTWELSENNREREIQVLIRGCQALGMREGKIITGSQEESLSRDGIRISVIPFWKF